MKKSFILVFLSAFLPLVLASSELYFIDIHSQIDHKAKGLKQVLKRMNENNVKTTFLTTRGKRDWREIIDWSEQYPGRIIPIMRTKGGDYQHKPSKFFQKMATQASYDNFKGISETLLYHAQKGNKAPLVKVKISDKRFQYILEKDLKEGWPVVLHIEFASMSKELKQEYMSDMEKLLQKYPNHPFVLIHMGQLKANEAQSLIEKHANLYFITSHTSPVTINESKQPWVSLFDGYSFRAEWKEMFLKYPKRFIFGIDNVWAKHWKKDYGRRMKYWKKALGELDDKTANLIAHGNAQRLWKLPTD